MKWTNTNVINSLKLDFTCMEKESTVGGQFKKQTFFSVEIKLRISKNFSRSEFTKFTIFCLSTKSLPLSPPGIGFGGLWRFAGTFNKSTGSSDTAELFVNCLEKAMMVESCLPGDDLDILNPYPSSLGICSNLNLSSSMSNLSVTSVHSPTDKDNFEKSGANGARPRHSTTSLSAGKPRGGSFKQKEKKKIIDVDWTCDYKSMIEKVSWGKLTCWCGYWLLMWTYLDVEFMDIKCKPHLDVDFIGINTSECGLYSIISFHTTLCRRFHPWINDSVE